MAPSVAGQSQYSFTDESGTASTTISRSKSKFEKGLREQSERTLPEGSRTTTWAENHRVYFNNHKKNPLLPRVTTKPLRRVTLGALGHVKGLFNSRNIRVGTFAPNQTPSFFREGSTAGSRQAPSMVASQAVSYPPSAYVSPPPPPAPSRKGSRSGSQFSASSTLVGLATSRFKSKRVSSKASSAYSAPKRRTSKTWNRAPYPASDYSPPSRAYTAPIRKTSKAGKQGPYPSSDYSPQSRAHSAPIRKTPQTWNPGPYPDSKYSPTVHPDDSISVVGSPSRAAPTRASYEPSRTATTLPQPSTPQRAFTSPKGAYRSGTPWRPRRGRRYTDSGPYPVSPSVHVPYGRFDRFTARWHYGDNYSKPHHSHNYATDYSYENYKPYSYDYYSYPMPDSYNYKTADYYNNPNTYTYGDYDPYWSNYSRSKFASDYYGALAGMHRLRSSWQWSGTR